MTAVSIRKRAKDRKAGRQFFRKLASHDKWELGDQFVLGSFDWREWFSARPSAAFIDGVEDERLYWEVTS